MSQYLVKLPYLTKGHHKSFVVMFFIFLFISGLEVFGTGIIGPFIAIATNLDIVKTNSWLNLLYTNFNFNSEQEFLVALGLCVVIAFYLKAVFKFGYKLKGELSCRLMKAYLAAPYSFFHLNINLARLIQDIISTMGNDCIGVIMGTLTSKSNLKARRSFISLRPTYYRLKRSLTSTT